DEFGGGGAKGLEAILDGAIANGHGEMSFAAAGPAVKDQGAALSDEVRTQKGTEQRLPQSRLQSEIELIAWGVLDPPRTKLSFERGGEVGMWKY
ncbi:MAG: hypothetical protein WB776_24140, partial [Candidatus Sulfotelmatobacter sp.]